MLKYFLKPLTCVDIIVIVLISVWFLLVFFNKGKRLQILIFLASHVLFYLSKMILNEGNFFIPSAIVLLVSFTVLIIHWLNKSKEIDGFSKNRWVYCFLTIVLTVVFFFGCILVEASSILMPPPH